MWIKDIVSNDVSEKYKIGTLEYTKRGLLILFLWLMWGDFCFTIMETVFGPVTTLSLNKFGANNFIVGLVITTIPNILNTIVCPWVSFISDRHRSKKGRRIPFITISTPFISAFLVIMGLAPDIGRFLYKTVFSHTSISETTLIILIIGIASAIYKYFDMFVGSVFYYLFNDVVPEEFLSRFMAGFRVVGTLAGAAFQFFVLRYAGDHAKWILVGAGILYFVAFTQMTWNVKEGEYPPPPENVDGQIGIFSAMKTYFNECFIHKFYWLFFLGTAFAEVTAAASPFILLMQTKSLHLSLANIGFIGGTGLLITTALLVPMGILSDKRHPIRTNLWATGILALLYPLRCVYLFVDVTPHQALIIEWVLSLLIIPATAMYFAANLPMYMRLLPAERYGQFCSAQAMVRSILLILAGVSVGFAMDQAKLVTLHFGTAANHYYRFAPVVMEIFWLTSFLILVPLYRMWLKFGGDKHYIPPAVGADAAKVEELL